MFALVRRNITTVPVGLFLKIIVRLPNYLMLNYSSKGCNAGKIGRMDKNFQRTDEFKLPIHSFSFACGRNQK